MACLFLINKGWNVLWIPYSFISKFFPSNAYVYPFLSYYVIVCILYSNVFFLSLCNYWIHICWTEKGSRRLKGERKAKVLLGLVMIELINIKENRGYLLFCCKIRMLCPSWDRIFFIFSQLRSTNENIKKTSVSRER